MQVWSQPNARFNVLLTEDREHTIEHWTQQLPRLLGPQGVAAFVVRTGREAMQLAQSQTIHAAVIDLGTPLETVSGPGSKQSAASFASEDPGLWLVELLRRLPNRPPVVLLRSPAFSRRRADQLLGDALRLGAFSVLDKPVELEQLLAVFQRLVNRQYRGFWPNTPEAEN